MPLYIIMAMAALVLGLAPPDISATTVAKRDGGVDDAESGAKPESSLTVLSPLNNVSSTELQLGQRSARNEGNALYQPLPPNTGMSLVAAVVGTTVANDAYWAEACKKIPGTASGIAIDMGDVSLRWRCVTLARCRMCG